MSRVSSVLFESHFFVLFFSKLSHSVCLILLNSSKLLSFFIVKIVALIYESSDRFFIWKWLVFNWAILLRSESIGLYKIRLFFFYSWIKLSSKVEFCVKLCFLLREILKRNFLGRFLVNFSWKLLIEFLSNFLLYWNLLMNFFCVYLFLLFLHLLKLLLGFISWCVNTKFSHSMMLLCAQIIVWKISSIFLWDW